MDTNEEISIKSARWFAEKLGSKPPDVQGLLLRSNSLRDFQQHFGPQAAEAMIAKGEWQKQIGLGNYIEIPEALTERASLPTERAHEQGISMTDAAGVGAIGAFGGYSFLRNRKYNNFKKEAEKFAKNKAADWNKNPDLSYAKSAEGARKRALNEYHDRFLTENPEQAKKWAKQHKDESLQKAIKKKEILDTPNTRRDQKELERFLDKQGIKNPEKTHSAQDDITQEEAGQRLRAAAEIGKEQEKQFNSATTERLENYREQLEKERAQASPLILPPAKPIQPAITTPPIANAASMPRASLRARSLRGPSRLTPSAPKLSLKKRTEKKALIWMASFGLPAIVAVLPFLLIFLVFIVIVGAATSDPLGFGTQIGLGTLFNPPVPEEPDPGPNPAPGGNFQVPPCNQVWDGLRNDFGVSVFVGDGDTRSSSCHNLQAIYRTYAIASRSSKYYSILRGSGPFRIRLYSGSGCFGTVFTSNTIKLYVMPENPGRDCFFTSGPTGLILHETGHQIRQQTQPLIMPVSKLRQLQNQDPSCYNQWGFLKTYSRTDTDQASESMADAVKLYIMNRDTEGSGVARPIYNFKSECRDTYNYIGGAVFGGYEFN